MIATYPNWSSPVPPPTFTHAAPPPPPYGPAQPSGHNRHVRSYSQGRLQTPRKLVKNSLPPGEKDAGSSSRRGSFSYFARTGAIATERAAAEKSAAATSAVEAGGSGAGSSGASRYHGNRMSLNDANLARARAASAASAINNDGINSSSSSLSSRSRAGHQQQRHFSASALLSPNAAATIRKKDDTALLKPPPRSLRVPTRVPSSSHHPSATKMAGHAEMLPATVASYGVGHHHQHHHHNQHHHHDRFYSGHHNHSASSFAPPTISNAREQSTEDFVMRTERSKARALQQYQQQQQQLHQQQQRQQQQQQQQQQQSQVQFQTHYQQTQQKQQHKQAQHQQSHQPQYQQQSQQQQDQSSNNRWSLQTPAMQAAAITEGLPQGPPPPRTAAEYASYPRRLSSASNASAISAVSSTAESTAPTTNSREMWESRMRSPSWGSQTSFDSYYSAHSTVMPASPGGMGMGMQPGGGARGFPYGAGGASMSAWQRPALLKQRRKARPGEQFGALPGEVLELIMDELKKLHLGPGSTSCATCWMRDACSVAMSARKWLKFARTAIYEDVQLVGADSAAHKKKLKGVIGTRMVLLRRTLRSNPLLAAMVRSLKVPAVPPGVGAEEYQSIVATLVMACPNLERVVGFYPTYDHSFGRLFHSLSTRQRLKEMNWILLPSPFQRQQRMRKPAALPEPSQNGQQQVSKRNLVMPGDLQPQQTISWMEMHAGWRYLSSLTIHCAPGATLTPVTLLVDTVRSLPALQTLYLSHLPPNAFNDSGLLSLPPLRKLSLVHLPGVSSSGISAFATRASGRSLTSLTLVHIELDSLPALARMLSNLSSLSSLSLVQSFPPILPADEVIWLFPYLASSSLVRLHWDIPTTFGNAQGSAADSILAKSISAGGFPALRRLRAPADPEGMFQGLCRPVEKVDLPGDRYRHRGAGQKSAVVGAGAAAGQQHSRAGSVASSQPGSESKWAGGGGGSPTSPRFPPEIHGLEVPRPNSDLHQARLAAQARLEAARNFPRWFVNVVDEDGTLVDKFGLAGFVGTVGSRIHYHLLPDAGGLDEKGGLVDVADLLGDGGEDLTGTAGGSAVREGLVASSSAGSIASMASSGAGVGAEGAKGAGVKEKITTNGAGGGDGEPSKAREGCYGRWNTYSGAVIDKKDKDRWFHTERGRWRAVALS